ncbi:MAG: ABC transporter permease subunit [Gammaproteobacteria bacterium]
MDIPVASIALNGVIAGSIYALVGLSFALIYSTVHFLNFAHAIVFTSAAYSSFVFYEWARLPLSLSILYGIVLSTLLGCAIERVVYRPLRKKGATPLTILLSSLGACRT